MLNRLDDDVLIKWLPRGGVAGTAPVSEAALVEGTCRALPILAALAGWAWRALSILAALASRAGLSKALPVLAALICKDARHYLL